MRVITDKEYCHERLGDQFESALSDFDTQRRLEVLINEFLGDIAADNAKPGPRKALDVGCGLGYFSQSLSHRGFDVLACDLGPNLVQRTRERVGCRAEVADALHLVSHFGSNSFDVVVSSECIEHTPDPYEVVRQMAGVLKPGGLLSISTPNLVWQPIVRAAGKAKLRPFNGYENFSSWSGLRHTLDQCGIDVIRERGLHLVPFQFGLHRLSRWMDQHLQALRSCMINICLLGQKRLESGEQNPRANEGGQANDQSHAA